MSFEGIFESISMTKEANEYEQWLCTHIHSLPVLAELVEWWWWVTGFVGVLYRHWKRWPGEQLLVLGQTATESFTGCDGLKRDLREKQTGRNRANVIQSTSSDFKCHVDSV